MRKVFISTPMHGLDDSDIYSNIRSAEDECKKRFPGEHIVCKTSYGTVPVDIELISEQERRRAKYLGHAIGIMASCDLVFFFGNWKESKGCRIEHAVCEEYGIPYMEV